MIVIMATCPHPKKTRTHFNVLAVESKHGVIDVSIPNLFNKTQCFTKKKEATKMTKLNEMTLHLYLGAQNLVRDKIVAPVRRMIHDEDGQGMSEYALIVVLVAIAVIGGVITMRTEIQNMLTAITTGLRLR